MLKPVLVRVDEDVWREAKSRAAEEGVSLETWVGVVLSRAVEVGRVAEAVVKMKRGRERITHQVVTEKRSTGDVGDRCGNALCGHSRLLHSGGRCERCLAACRAFVEGDVTYRS